MKNLFRKVLLVKIALFVILIMGPISSAQYGDPGPPPAPDTPRAEGPREIEAEDPAFAPNTVLDAPDPALGGDGVISEPESFDIDPGPGGISTEPYEGGDLPPGGVVSEPDSSVEQSEPLVEGDPLIRQPEGLVEQGEPLVEQPDPLVKQPPALVEQPDPLVDQPNPLVEQPPALVEQPEPLSEEPAALVPQGEAVGGHGPEGRGVR